MSAQPPLVSIVIPAYNHAGYVAQAVDSVLAQDYPTMELIVIDDGSTDETTEVLQAYRGRAILIRHDNCGQAATLNKGWAIAKGDILGYLSADDYLFSDAVSTTVMALEAAPEAIVTYGDFDLVDPNGNLTRHVATPEFKLEDMLTKLVCPPGPGAFFRRCAFEIAGGWNPELRQIADFDFWLRLARHGRFIRIARPLAAWRVHEASQSFAPVSRERAEEAVRVMTAFFSRCERDSEIAPLRSRALARAHVFAAQLHARSSRYRAALSSFGQAFRLYPGVLARPETWRSVSNVFLSRPAHRILWRLRRIPRAKT